jgi:hypothetical protein
MGCFSSLLLLALFVFIVVTMIRFFEQVTEAVDNGWWNKVFVLLAMPFTVWFFPSRVSAGRPTAVPHHEPVRGFGIGTSGRTMPEPAPPEAGSPPGTPKEFLELPKPTPAKPRTAIDAEKIAKLKQKMREQGMLPPEQDS